MKKNIILSTILSLILCVSLITGATFALFTSESDVNIAVTSGKVKVEASVAEHSSNFVNGGTLTIDGNNVSLNNLVPGDKVELVVTIENSSTVAFKQRLSLVGDKANALYDSLIVGVSDVYDAENATPAYTYYADAQTGWTDGAIQVDGASQQTYVYVSIALPEYVGNSVQGLACKMSLVVEAIQANATVAGTGSAKFVHVVSDQTALDNAVANAADGETIILDGGDWASANIAFDDARELTIRGYKVTDMTVTAPLGTVHVYNQVENLVGAVAPDSLHVHGVVEAITLTAGRVVIASTAIVNEVIVDAVDGTQVKVEVAEGNALNSLVVVSGDVVADGTIASVTGEIRYQATTLEEIEKLASTIPANAIIVVANDIVIDDVSGGTSGKTFALCDIAKDITLDLGGYSIAFADSVKAGSVTGVPCILGVGANVVIKNGTIDVECGNNGAYGIKLTAGTLTLDNVTVTGAPTAVQLSGGDLVIESGMFKLADTVSNTSASLAKYLINCIDSAYVDGKANIQIKGGSFVGFNPVDVYAEPTQPISWLADGCVVLLENGVYTVYPSLQNAIDTLSTVTLVHNVALSEGLKVSADKEVVLDLAGYTISYNSDLATVNAAITNNGKLTITDSSANGNGKITYQSSAPSTNYSYATDTILNGGTLVIDGGILENTTAGGASYVLDTAWYSDASAPTTIINGGTIESDARPVRIVGYESTQTLKFEINGGKINAPEIPVQITLMSSDNAVTPLVDLTITGGTLGGYWSVYSISNGASYSGTSITISGGEFLGDVAVGGGSANGGLGAEVVTITGGTFHGGVYSYNANAEDISIYGGSFAYLQDAIDNAVGCPTISVLGNIADETITVDNPVKIVGVGEWETVLNNVVFDIDSSSESINMNVTFENIKFTGTSRIIVGQRSHHNGIGGPDSLPVTALTINNCYAKTEFSSDSLAGGKGQFVYLAATYTVKLDLTMVGNTMINAHTIADEDSAPIVNGNGTVINNVYISGNTFGDEQNTCDRYAVKFGRRANGANIVIENNVVYGATTAEKDFYILDLWQSGSNVQNDLTVTISGNTINCTADEGRAVYTAYIESSVTGSNLVINSDGAVLNKSVEQ